MRRPAAPRRPTALSFISTMSRIIGSGSVGVLAQREGDVVEHRQVGEQRAELEQHAQPAAQRYSCSRSRGSTTSPSNTTAPGGRVHAADQAQQRRLAAARAAQDRGDLAARKPSQPPSTAPPMAPTTCVAWFASVPSEIDCTTPVPVMPAPCGVVAHAASSSAATRAIQ
jgi:hypothetical protein